jgi:hypothetical protein
MTYAPDREQPRYDPQDRAANGRTEKRINFPGLTIVPQVMR